MKKLSLKNLKLEANDLLERNQLKSVFGGYSNGNEGINPYCCWDYAEYKMTEIPDYADPENEEYLTYSQRYDIWLYYYDGCMGGGVNGCLPAN